MTAISIWEPWATAMFLGLKRNETRSWPTRHRGDLLICASKRALDSTATAILRNVIEMAVGHKVDPQPGMALCVVRMIRCDQIASEATYTYTLPTAEVMLGDYTAGRYAWVTANLRPLARPFPVRGQQGLFDVQDELVKGAIAP